MEIHKPHAAKSWKEFFIELGTIVLGIIIAISLEQFVEYLHWDHEVSVARRAIAAEMTANNTSFFAFRAAIAPCLDRQMNESQAIIAALANDGKAQSLAGFRSGLHALLSDAEWQSERSSQVLTHFPRDELALMSSYYSQLPNFEDWMNTEAAAWQELSILQDTPAAIPASDLNRLRVNLFTARRMEYLIERNSRRELALSRKLGMRLVPPPWWRQRIQTFCSRMSLDDWHRWQNATQTDLAPSSARLP
jgi:hypothetical protein